jgi:pyruvate ferredoxin oxidoreductase gamma subunit
MFRIRFHGRGGQGMKTASRIVGTAAFRQGRYAQDSPVYGAERRGAPMIAFTRFDDKPILERGVVSSPDLVVVADASLLDDPMVRPLSGLVSNGTVLINAARPPEGIEAAVTCDFTGMALDHTGSIAALSVALGAASAKLAGLEEKWVEQAVLDELSEIKLDASRLEKNVNLARACFAHVQPQFVPSSRISSVPPEVRVITPAYEGAWAGSPTVVSEPNTPLRKTGDWRVMRPSINLDRCTHCWICFLNCPDGAITLGAADTPQIDYGVCKGCLLCAEECPISAIEINREAMVHDE